MKFLSALPVGRYRVLTVAIALFVVLDLGVLLFSFYVSSQIRADAVRVATAGELSMLSQLVTKSLLTLSEETKQALPNQTSLAQLAAAVPKFRGNLERLRDELKVSSEDAIWNFFLAERMAAIAEQLDKVRKTWTPMEEAINPVVAVAAPSLDLVGLAMTRAVADNIKLNGQADDLTEQLAETAAERAAALREVQIVGIVLALLNFFFIAFKFLRTLELSDRKLLRSKEETDRILSSVREGLFLVRRDGRVSEQYSASLQQILGIVVVPGVHIFDLFRSCLNETQYEAGREYLELLIEGRVQPAMVKQLNPLTETGLRHGEGRFASFDFSPIVGAGDRNAPEHTLLVTVFDVSERHALERAVVTAKERARGEIELLSEVLDTDAVSLNEFLRTSDTLLNEANLALRDVKGDSEAYKNLAISLFRTAHNIKGQASMLGLQSVEQETHHFEESLVDLRSKKLLSGEDFIPISLQLRGVMDRLTRVRGIADKLAGFARSTVVDGGPIAATDAQAIVTDSLPKLTASLSEFAQRVASDEKKRVSLVSSIASSTALPAELLANARALLPQLIRNAIVHGIETPQERAQLGKPEVGTIELRVSTSEATGISLHVRDDGRGISLPDVRKSLVESGRKSVEEANALSPSQVISTLFESGVSTLTSSSLNAGRGVGLDVAREIADQAGGKIRVQSTPNVFSEFSVQFPATAVS